MNKKKGKKIFFIILLYPCFIIFHQFTRSWIYFNTESIGPRRTALLLSRLPLKSVPLLVWAAVDVTGLLAIADPLFIFHLFCLCLSHLVLIPQLLVHYLTLCFPKFVSEWLIVVLRSVFVALYLFIQCVLWYYWVKLLSLLISAVLCLTHLTLYTQTLYNGSLIFGFGSWLPMII